MCPLCKMDLVATRRAEAWTCPVHSLILESEGGACPIGGRDLIPIRLELTWTCSDHPDVRSLEPGMCPVDGERRLAQRLAALPHEDHTAKHGGTFFMAPDNWHHLEGTYPEPGRFVLYVYDNYSQPLAPGSLNGAPSSRKTTTSPPIARSNQSPTRCSRLATAARSKPMSARRTCRPRSP